MDSLGQNPQIPELLAHFEQKGKLYLVQEYIDGQNLAQILQEEGVFSKTQIRELLTGLLPVLQFIHENNVIHRDIKPENIIRRNIPPLSTPQSVPLLLRGVRGDQYVLVDFGAARYVTGTAILKTGTTIGDVRYMSDEQLQGKAIFASDIYSLGLTCLHLLTGIDTWSLFDSGEGEWAWRNYMITPVSEELGQVLDKMVQKATKRRFGSAREVLDVLNPSGVETVVQSSKVETSSVSSEVLEILNPSEVETVIQSSKVETSSVSSEVSSSPELVRFQLYEKWGYKDETGKIVTQLFDDICSFSEGLAGFKINGKWGFIDKTRNIVI